MHGSRKYRRGAGGGGGGSGPSATSFFSHQLNLRFFLKKTIIFKDSREGPTFSGGGGGVKLYPGGIRIQITCDFPGGGFGPPFPLWILTRKLTLQMFCSWFEDVHVMCFGHYRQIIFSVTFFMNL